MFDEFAQLYEACLTTSPALVPPVVDDMELWEVAVMLGKALPKASHRDESRPGRSMAEERVRAWKEGKPQPTWDDAEPSPGLHPLVGTLIPSNLPPKG